MIPFFEPRVHGGRQPGVHPTETVSAGFPGILVIVPTLGTRPAWLSMTVRSILEQPGVRARVVLVSRTPNVVFTEAGLQRSVELVVHEEDGLSSAINRGFSEAREEFVTWLGDDDLLAPRTLADSLIALEARPKASFLYGRTRYIDTDGSTIGFTRPGRFAQSYLSIGKNFVPQPGSVLRTSFVRQWGSLRTDLTNAMDLEMFLGLRGLGKGIYRPVELSAYRLHADSITVGKGVNNEAELVRRAHLGKFASSTYAVWRPATRVLDRVLDASTRRLVFPPPPTVRGRPYTWPLTRTIADPDRLPKP